MVVTVYYKGPHATQAVATYDLALSEVVRLNNDYVSYRKTGKPTGGFYTYRTTNRLDQDEQRNVYIDFEAIQFME